MKKLAATVVMFVLIGAAGCDSKKVGQGEECRMDEQCDDKSTACLIAEGSETGYCTRSCNFEASPDARPECLNGLVCTYHETEHFSLGSTYCSPTTS